MPAFFLKQMLRIDKPLHFSFSSWKAEKVATATYDKHVTDKTGHTRDVRIKSYTSTINENDIHNTIVIYHATFTSA